MDPDTNNIPMTFPKPRGGYALLSSFIASDKAFCVFRRYDTLAIRNLLYMQDELYEIEQQIRDLDESDMTSANQRDVISLHSRRADQNVMRVTLMQRANEKLKYYGESRMIQKVFLISYLF
jgi:hypothetical protein